MKYRPTNSFSTYLENNKRWPQDILLPKRYFKINVKKLPPIPAYFFHTADFNEISLIFKQLARRSMQSLTFSDLLNKKANNRSSVILSFDDGWSSVWSVVFPLARIYGIRFTLFVVPNAIIDSNETRLTIDQGLSLKSSQKRDNGSSAMLTWGEVRAMHKSGLVDIQSHSLNHGVVYSSDSLIGLSSKKGPFPISRFVPLIRKKDGKDMAYLSLPIGTPIYQYGPALAVKRRLLEDPIVCEQYSDIVKINGGGGFLDSQNAKVILRNIVKQSSHSWETDYDRAERFRNDLLEAKKIIESRIRGSNVRILAVPWGVMHSDIPSIARETGHKIVVMAYPFPKYASNRQIQFYPRLKGDTIWILLYGPIYGTFKWLKVRKRIMSNSSRDSKQVY